MIRQLSWIVLATVVGLPAACSNRANVQCENDTNCDLSAGGICAAASNGNRWCAYPDPACPEGYRYTNQDVGDGLAGICVAVMVDAGVDASIAFIPNAASCIGLPLNCGAVQSDSCCNSPMVPGGMFYRGYDLIGDIYSGNTNFPAKVSSFHLDKYDVTVGRFRLFLEAGMGTQANPPVAGAGAHAKIPESGWQQAWNTELVLNTGALASALKCDPLATWTDTRGPNETRPINCVDWYEAMAFCIWDGGYLPTEAELMYSESGGEQQRTYPWSIPPQSAVIDDSRASYGALGPGSTNECNGDGQPQCTIDDLIKVGSKPYGDGRWGHSDLAGNVFNFAADWYASSSFPNPCDDCLNFAITFAGHVLHGGAFDSLSLRLHDTRASFLDTGRLRNVGIRCARGIE